MSSFKCLILSFFVGCAVGQRPFGGRPFGRPAFGRFGNFPHNSNSYAHYPASGASGSALGGMAGNVLGNTLGNTDPATGFNFAGGRQPAFNAPQGTPFAMPDMGPVGGVGGNNDFSGDFGSSARGGVCPMVRGVADMIAFKTSCLSLLQNPSSDAECTPGRWGKQCRRGSKCCPKQVGGVCSFSCSDPIQSPMKSGSCPSDTFDKPLSGQEWIGPMCFYGQSIGVANSAECRFDADCQGAQKCCSPSLNTKNPFASCVRKCTNAS